MIINKKNILLGLLCLILTANFANAEEKTVKRWAIISSKDNESKKLADLLFAELADDFQIELVERDELTKISSEQELGNLSEAENSKHRLKLLNLIKADRLITLSVNSLAKPPSVRMVISESGQGARLKVLRFPYVDETESVKRLESEISRCRKKYAEGIEKIVAVAPLLPKNISHKYDSLGIIYQELLESELVLVPGLAVLEISEARKIAEELAASGNELKQRIVPILINGEYEIFSDSNEVRLELYARQNGKVLASVKKNINKKTVVPFFKKIISETVLDKNKVGDTFSLDQQYEWLVNQAENASQIALPENAIGLREAALMIKPDNTNERLALLKDYYNFYEYHYNIPKGTKDPEKKKIYAELASGRVNAYIRATEHIEFLVRNKKIDRERAAKLIGWHRVSKLGSVFPTFFIKNKEGKYDKVYNDKIKDIAVDAQFEMDKNLFPLLNQLVLPKPNYGTGLSNIQLYLMNSYLNRVNDSRRGNKPFEKCLYYFNEIFPAKRHTSYYLQTFFIRKIPEKDDFSRITTQEWLTFLNNLSKSDKELCRCLAEAGLINASMWTFKELGGNEKKLLAERVKSLMSRWEKLPEKSRHEKRNEEPIYNSLQRFYTKLTGIKPKSESRVKRKTKPTDYQTNPETWRYWGMPYMLGQLRFGELKVHYNDKIYPYYLEHCKFLARIKNFDILWGWKGVWKLDKHLKITSLIDENRGKIRDVHYDGKYIWIQHEHPEKKYTYTVSLYTLDGKKVAGMETMFPNHSWSIRIMPYAKGKILVAGCMRPHYRAWLGTVILVDGKLEYKTFFQAKKMPTENDQGDYTKETNLVFSPKWIHLVKMKDEKDNFILIGREGRNNQRWRAPPLALNIGTMEIGILKTTLNSRIKDSSLFSKNGIVFHPGGIDTVELPEEWNNWKKFKRKEYGEWTPGRLTGEIYDVFLAGTVFLDDKYIYVFGRKCYRIDLNSFKEESLIKGYLTRKYQMEWVRKSANHGFLGFTDGGFYKVKIVDKHHWYPDLKTEKNENK